MNHETFAKNLRLLRQEKNYTQERLAEELGVSPQAVSRWECGTTLPDVMLLPDIARLYGITVDDLFKEEINTYENYAQRLLAVYEATRKSEDFLAAEQEFLKLLAGEHTANDLRGFGVLYHYMTRYCAARAEEYLDAAIEKAEKEEKTEPAGKVDWIGLSAAQQKLSLLCDLGRGREEAVRYEKETEKYPSDPKSWLLCVAAYHFVGENEQADEMVKKALTRFSENALLHCYAGDICKELNRQEEAFFHWEKTLELDPAVMAASYSMAFCHEELEQYGKAYKQWSEIKKDLLRQGLTQECKFVEEHIRECERKLK